MNTTKQVECFTKNKFSSPSHSKLHASDNLSRPVCEGRVDFLSSFVKNKSTKIDSESMLVLE